MCRGEVGPSTAGAFLNRYKQMGALISPFYQPWTRRGSSEPRDSNLSACSRASEDASDSLSCSLQGMSVTPGSADHPLSEHMRERLAENRTVFNVMLAGAGQRS